MAREQPSPTPRSTGPQYGAETSRWADGDQPTTLQTAAVVLFAVLMFAAAGWVLYYLHWRASDPGNQSFGEPPLLVLIQGLLPPAGSCGTAFAWAS